MNFFQRIMTKKVVFFLIMLVFAIIIMFPFYWMIISSFQTNSEIFSTNMNIIPKSISLNNYIDLIKETNFLRWLLNSVVVTVITTILGLFFSTFAGYAFAKYNFFAKNILFVSVFLMISIPRLVTIIPILSLMSNLMLTNTYWALILPFSVNPLAVFLMRQYIKSIPDELIDCARIDGCNEIQIVIRIIMPIAKPALGAAGIFIVMMTWNDYLFPLILMSESEMTLFPVGLSSLKPLFQVEYGMIMAGSLLSTLPLIAGFLVFQKQFIAGITEGSVKG